MSRQEKRLGKARTIHQALKVYDKKAYVPHEYLSPGLFPNGVSKKILCFNSIPPEAILFDDYKIYMLGGAFGALGVIFARIGAKMFCSFHAIDRKSRITRCCKKKVVD